MKILKFDLAGGRGRYPVYFTMVDFDSVIPGKSRETERKKNSTCIFSMHRSELIINCS